jgi:hypothetical protein
VKLSAATDIRSFILIKLAYWQFRPAITCLYCDKAEADEIAPPRFSG